MSNNKDYIPREKILKAKKELLELDTDKEFYDTTIKFAIEVLDEILKEEEC